MSCTLSARHLQIAATNGLEMAECILKNNDITKFDIIPVGGAIFPTMSFFNHSCYPNATRLGFQNHQVTCVKTKSLIFVLSSRLFGWYGWSPKEQKWTLTMALTSMPHPWITDRRSKEWDMFISTHLGLPQFEGLKDIKLKLLQGPGWLPLQVRVCCLQSQVAGVKIKQFNKKWKNK